MQVADFWYFGCLSILNSAECIWQSFAVLRCTTLSWCVWSVNPCLVCFYFPRLSVWLVILWGLNTSLPNLRNNSKMREWSWSKAEAIIPIDLAVSSSIRWRGPGISTKKDQWLFCLGNGWYSCNLSSSIISIIMYLAL